MAQTETMTGGEAIVRAAVANGIDTIFGLPGAQIYPMFDAIYRMPEVKSVISRHEQGAAYMAFGAAAATGKPSAYAVVPGPGVLNTAAALCTAAGTNKPVLCLTGQIMSEFLGVGRGHLHELSVVLSDAAYDIGSGTAHCQTAARSHGQLREPG